MIPVLLTLALAVTAGDVEADYRAHLGDLYRHLHAHPELSFAEVETARSVADELRAAGLEVTEGVGGNGVVGVLRNGDGPTVMVRADLDALPIEETTGLPYASQATQVGRDGVPVPVMHACGHDVHLSVLIGTARQMARQRDRWSGTLVMIGQPAEERSGGAKAMLADGLFERFPRPDYNLALHVASDIEAGKVAAVSGYFMANVDSVDILVRGVGGHGAYPNRGRDPVVLAAQLVGALQTIVSREISPLEPAVVTVGAINGGSQHNIIPNEVKLQLTLRSYSDEVRELTLASIRRLAEHMGRAHGLPDELLPVVTVLDEHTPAAYNDPALTARALRVFAQTLGADHIVEAGPEMVGEDFGRYGREGIPSLMFRLGTVDPAQLEAARRGEAVLPGLHSSSFAPLPQPTIVGGVRAMTGLLHDLLGPAD